MSNTGFRVLQLFSNSARQAPPVQLLRPLTSGAQGSFDGPGDAGFSGKSEEDDSASQLRALLLDTALDGGHVKAHGWSAAALTAAATEMKLSPAVTGILKRREAELVEHAIRRNNTAHMARLQERGAELLALPELQQRLSLALRIRLELLQPHMDTWPQALSVATRPPNLRHSLQLLSELVDNVWHAAGDQATDSSWYGKRALLAGVYCSTELLMLTDSSPGYSETWEALDRRLADMLMLSRAGRQG